MEGTIAIATVYKELKEFRVESEKCWQQNEKRWEENDRRWKANDERWKTNDKKLTTLERLSEKADERLTALEKLSESTDKRLTALEKGRTQDRKDILNILDTMQKSIDNQFSDLKEYMDVRFDKIYSAQMVNDIEHAEFRQLLKVYGVRINLQNSRITYLENWKKECDDGFVAVN
ncbi:MAG: hypothetical protein HFJ40_07750 [Clostridia bacterium]|nr:hypothetical protein [Clostridia bacterium]